MDSGKRARMSGVECLQQVEGFSAADLTQNDPVRPVPQSRAQQIPDRDGRQVRLAAARLKPNHVVFCNLNLSSLLDHDQTVGIGNEC